MVFEQHPSPARVSAAAAAKLPRAALIALLMAYIASGLFGRDPWQEDDATGFGVMWTMAHGQADWLLPSVAGEWVTSDGPLAYWFGAASIALLGPLLGDIAAARLTVMLWFFFGTAALWYGMLRLARREEAQPVAFAFGGEANARDYGRMLADVALLLLLGTIGPIVVLHETTSEPAAFALSCLVIYGLVLSLERPFAGAIACGAVIGLLVLARGAQPALWLALAALPTVACTFPRPVRLRAGASLLLIAVVAAGAWLLAVVVRHGEAGITYLMAWSDSSLRVFNWPTAESLTWLLRTLPWYAWPLWPLAAWSLYAWRHGIRRPHMALPSALLAATLAGLLATRSASAADAVFIVAPMVLLAAFGVVAQRRAAENTMDWFAITAFCLFWLALWAYFVATQAGFPPKMARSVLRLTAGYVPPLQWAQLLIALAASGFWLVLVLWRARQPAPVLWRGPMLAAAGLVTLWVGFSSLFFSAVDYRRSFAGPARQAAAELAARGQSGACVRAHHLRPSHLAVFAYHGRIRFLPDDDNCPFALHRDLADSLLDDSLPSGRWTEIWQGNRPGREDETIRLYQRLPE